MRAECQPVPLYFREYFKTLEILASRTPLPLLSLFKSSLIFYNMDLINAFQMPAISYFTPFFLVWVLWV